MYSGFNEYENKFTTENERRLNIIADGIFCFLANRLSDTRDMMRKSVLEQLEHSEEYKELLEANELVRNIKSRIEEHEAQIEHLGMFSGSKRRKLKESIASMKDNLKTMKTKFFTKYKWERLIDSYHHDVSDIMMDMRHKATSVVYDKYPSSLVESREIKAKVVMEYKDGMTFEEMLSICTPDELKKASNVKGQ